MKPSLTTILIIIVAVLATWMASLYFGKVRKTESMIRNEERLKHSEDLRIRDSVAFVERTTFYDSVIAASDQRYAELEAKKQPIYNAIKNIRTTVPDYTKDELRRAIANY